MKMIQCNEKKKLIVILKNIVQVKILLYTAFVH